jgi:hypothetical protein
MTWDYTGRVTSWDFAQCADFVTRNAPPALRRALLRPTSKQFNAKYPNISVTYYSMPDWLDIFKFGPGRVGGRKFDSIAHEYQFAAQKYQNKVVELLGVIDGQPGVGKAMLQEIAASKRRTLNIMPHLHWHRVILSGPINSSPRSTLPGQSLAHVSDGMLVNDVDAYAKRAPVRDDNGNPIRETGTGKGSNAVLFFSPEDWETKDSDFGPGSAPDEVIFHELVHVSRGFRGLETLLPVGEDYKNEEEYLATVITNLYLSEKGKDLRGVYSRPLQRPSEVKVGDATQIWVAEPLKKGWNVMKDSDKWYHNPGNVSMSPRQLIERFQKTQAAFFGALRALPDDKPKFNPIKQFLQEKAREKIRPDV